ncbi:MAG: endonuclease/exonuclease/phosphatase family protein [Magnetospiraceae bacterium]
MPLLRVVTANTLLKDPPYRQRLRHLSTRLSDISPDVVMLQDVYAEKRSSRNTADELAGPLGMEGHFFPTRCAEDRLPNGAIDANSGLALLTHLPVANAEALPLPSHPMDVGRWALFLVISYYGRDLLFVNLELSPIADGVEYRHQQLMTVVRHAATAYGNMPTVVGGDFHDTLDSGPVNWLLGQKMLMFGNREHQVSAQGLGVSRATDFVFGSRECRLTPPVPMFPNVTRFPTAGPTRQKGVFRDLMAVAA